MTGIFCVMKSSFEENNEVKIVKGFEDPFKPSEGKSGWVILHPRKIPKIINSRINLDIYADQI
jgi:hypothetical protein